MPKNWDKIRAFEAEPEPPRHHIVTVLEPTNPKQRKAAERWEAYQTGKTVAEVIAAIVAMGYSEREAMVDARWNLSKGFVQAY